MNSNLSPFANFGAYIHDLLSMYLLPVGLPVAIIVVLILLLIGRGKTVEMSALDQEQKPLPDAVPLDSRPAILVVDDSAVAWAKLSKLFETGGDRVELAKDGLEAMEKLVSDFYAVLVTDLEMPNMNGLELIAAVQGGLETEDLPIIAITGHDELQARVHDYQGLFGIFKKPWNDRELGLAIFLCRFLRSELA